MCKLPSQHTVVCYILLNSPYYTSIRPKHHIHTFTIPYHHTHVFTKTLITLLPHSCPHHYPHNLTTKLMPSPPNSCLPERGKEKGLCEGKVKLFVTKSPPQAKWNFLPCGVRRICNNHHWKQLMLWRQQTVGVKALVFVTNNFPVSDSSQAVLVNSLWAH